jgi:beta-lactamase superfamily II metal-dependent hydrolase
MRLDVFNVEHGACAVLHCDNGQHFMFDCGHNASTGWRPGDYLAANGAWSLRTLFVTNYDEDHVSGIRNLFAKVNVETIFRNTSVTPQMIKSLKTEDGMGLGIEFLVAKLIEWAKNPGLVVGDIGFPPGVSVNLFHNRYGEFDDENNLSMAVELTVNGLSFMLTGDLEKAGWKKLLERADMRAALARTKIFFASHHGRESGCCPEIFDYCKPIFVVISDKAKGYQTQETHAFYHARASGGRVHGESDLRYVLTTRNDGHISFDVMADGSFYVYTTRASTQRSA